MSELRPGFDLKVIKQWEYLELNVDTDKRFVGHGESRLLSDAGRDGWELVTVIPQTYYEPGVHGAAPERWIFKKELIT